MTTYKKVKIFGERNTSTNALKALIEMNSEARVLPSVIDELRPNFRSLPRKIYYRLVGHEAREGVIDRTFATEPPIHAWKHCAPNFEDISSFHDVLVVLSVRNPFSWLRGLHKRPYHVEGPVAADLASFAQTPWQPRGRDRIGTAAVTPMALWNAKLGAYLELQNHLKDAGYAVRVVHFEDFAMGQLDVLEGLRPDLLNLASQPQALEKAAKATDQGTRDATYYRDYYGQERWKADISEEAHKVIRAGIDWQIAKAFGYQDWGSRDAPSGE